MWHLILALVVAPEWLHAGTVSFSSRAEEVRWVNPPGQVQRVESPSLAIDRTIAFAEVHTGVATAGDAHLEFAVPGRHLVEIFLFTAGQQDSFVLEVNGQPVDRRNEIRPGPWRLRPRRGTRRLYLVAMVSGPSRLTVRTASTAWHLSAMRWTPESEFEAALAPLWRGRMRHLLANPLLEGQEGGPGARPHYIAQLAERLRFSRDEAVRNEALLALTRSFYWVAAENHEPADIARTGELFEEALRVLADHPILRQMISAACTAAARRPGSMPRGDYCRAVEPVPWGVEIPPAPPSAPEWAVAQQSLARRMDAITRWWVEKRQQRNGELGGGWGDDVEIIRNWGPQALGFGSAVAARGVKALAEGIWSSGRLLHGYDRTISDVEHSSEPTTDTQPMLAALYPDDAAVLSRLQQTAACAAHWIRPQPDGAWRFRSSWFNCRQADESPGRAVDVHLNVRALGPALWYAFLTRDPDLIQLISRWAESWRKAMRATDHGKPPGIVPSVIWSRTGSYLVNSDAWDKPNAEWDYFQWSGESQEAITSLFLALHDLTGDRQWLDSAGETFQILEDCGRHQRLCEAIRSRPESWLEWRRRSGKPPVEESDAAILARMTEEARGMEQRLSTNFEMYTSEVMYTDRVYYALPADYRLRLFGGEAPRGERYPTFRVTWEPAPGDVARAVLESDSRRLRLRLYNFENRAVSVRFRAWQLEPGRYRIRGAGGPSEVTVARRPQAIAIVVPPQRDLTVTMTRSDAGATLQ